VESSRKMVTSAKRLASTPKDPSIYQAFSTHSKSLSDAMKKMITSIKESAPGQRESDQAIESLSSWVKGQSVYKLGIPVQFSSTASPFLF